MFISQLKFQTMLTLSHKLYIIQYNIKKFKPQTGGRIIWQFMILSK